MVFSIKMPPTFLCCTKRSFGHLIPTSKSGTNDLMDAAIANATA